MKSSTARFLHENPVEKFKIFVQDFVPIRTALSSKYIVITGDSVVGFLLEWWTLTTCCRTIVFDFFFFLSKRLGGNIGRTKIP